MPHAEEDRIEKAFCAWCRSQGFKALKLSLNGRRGFPDRTILLGNGKIVCVELKAPGGQASAHQSNWLTTLRKYGIPCLLTDSLDDAKLFVEREDMKGRIDAERIG